MAEPRATKDLSIYDTPVVDWAQVQASLDAGFTQAPGTGGPDRHTCWLGTVDPDGRPHVVGVGAFPAADGWWFTSGPGTRKSRNLAHDPRCTISVALDDFDLTVEGSAERVTDQAALERFAAVAREGGWPAEARDGAVWAEFSAPSAGPPPWWVWKLVPERAVALSVHEGGATRWDF
jgi:pyridoxine/pyridoxamine 5'-phosphate oxidase